MAAELRALVEVAGEAVDRLALTPAESLHHAVAARVFRAVGPLAAPSRVIHDDFFCGAAGWEGKSHGPQPRRALLRRTLLVKGRSLSAVYEPLQDDRPISNSLQRAAGNREVVAHHVQLAELCLARKVRLRRVGDPHLAPVEGEDFLFLRHRANLAAALALTSPGVARVRQGPSP